MTIDLIAWIFIGTIATVLSVLTLREGALRRSGK